MTVVVESCWPRPFLVPLRTGVIWKGGKLFNQCCSNLTGFGRLGSAQRPHNGIHSLNGCIVVDFISNLENEEEGNRGSFLKNTNANARGRG